jgi:hypothetical protein
MKKILLFAIALTAVSVAQAQFNGFALYDNQNTTYLIDENENIAHTWNMAEECNYTVQLKENGNLVRGLKYPSNILGGAAEGGKVQEVDPNGNIVWEYVYSDANHLSHHDLCLIGDNVLLTAWEVKSMAELTAAGYSNASSEKWPTHFVELEPDGNGGASIVWEWHLWDHMIQDVDSTKANYGSIADNPQLFDINMITTSGGGPGGFSGDWFHVNGVDYNEELDQIAFSSRTASEIYIIDHSTTTAEAAGHTGGNSGMGGDILYRWGNPANYDTPGSQIIPAAVHDVRWIKEGRPYAGYLQVFNNSGVSSSQSAVDAIKTPLNTATGYTYLKTAGQAFEPTNYSLRYTCAYSAPGQSASDRMSNGNIYVNASGGQGGAGVMYEVDSLGTMVWGPYSAGAKKGFRYECDYPGILALQSYMNTATTSCFEGLSVLEEDWKMNIYPNPVKEKMELQLRGLNAHTAELSIINSLGELVYAQAIDPKSLLHQLDFSRFPAGIYYVQVKADNGQSFAQKIAHSK